MTNHPRETRAAIEKLEYIAIALTAASFVARLLVMGTSVAMLAAILEDVTELVAPVAILLALRLESRPANGKFPFGYQRIGSLSFFSAALALLTLGVLTSWQGLDRLVAGGTRDFGEATLFGVTLWQGWIMIAVLVVTSVVMIPVLKVKRELAPRTQLAALQTDASSNLAHIVVAMGAALGIFLTRFGLGWADPAAAILIGVVIFVEGLRDLRTATDELIDVAPQPEIMEKLTRIAAAKPYVRSHYWLARKVGRFIDADLLIQTEDVPLSQIDEWRKELEQELRSSAWQLHDLTITFGVAMPQAKDEDYVFSFDQAGW